VAFSVPSGCKHPLGVDEILLLFVVDVVQLAPSAPQIMAPYILRLIEQIKVS
jgi:hypothetical protein